MSLLMISPKVAIDSHDISRVWYNAVSGKVFVTMYSGVEYPVNAMHDTESQIQALIDEINKANEH